MDRRLIVNADDLGLNAPRTHGIFQAFEQGIVTSASLVVTSRDSEAAARHARHKALPTGLHLNFTEGEPLSSPSTVSSLVQPNGEFFDRSTLQRLLDDGRVDPQHLEREARAQLSWFLDHHGPPTHVDSHHHVHVHPAAVAVLPDILLRFGVLCVRIPAEDLPPFGYEIDDATIAYARRIADLARAAQVQYASYGLRSPDAFRGLTLVGRASAKNLRHVLTRLPEGTTELMVHPGSMTPVGTPFDVDAQRQTELAMLTDPGVRVVLSERKIHLCSYGDLHVA